MLFLYKIGDIQTDSVLLRVITIYILSLYCYFLSDLCKKNPDLFFLAVKIYIESLLYACLCGGILFILILKGVVGEAQLSYITSGAHIIQFGSLNIFRFNPGSNVNEFSYILGIGIFLLNFINIERRKKNMVLFIFLICLFLTLTRAAWLSLLVAYVIYFLLNENSTKRMINTIIFSCFVFSIFAYIYSTVESFSYLVDSRLAPTIGVSGEERLEKFDFAYQSLLSSKMTLLFGHGWSTNMYIHNVYLQLLYELGVIGFIIFSVYIIYIILPIFFIKEKYCKATLISLIVFIFLFATMQHTLYHTQTWFILAIINSSIILNKKLKLPHEKNK
ncbi:O-antigen ligase family protein [Marinomonas sp.]|uniref:O-antigen ligase family protein n=1 Tax=Marinomonas sp. TaxID=1904862 RepID=UPI003A8DA59D